MADTIFDKFVRGEIKPKVVYEDEWVMAFHDINAQAPVHVLVIPRKKVVGFADLKDRPALEVGEFFVRVSKVAGLLGLDKNGYRVVLNNGRDAGQSVDYIHAHIIGGRELEWPPG